MSKSIVDVNPGKPLPFSAVHAQVNVLKGKVLTVVDATYHNAVQNKAVKDLIKHAFVEQLNYMAEICEVEYRIGDDGRDQHLFS